MTYDFKPLGIAVGFLLFIGLVFPFFLGFFITADNIEMSSKAQGLYDLVEDGISFDFPVIGEISFNPFDLLILGMKGQLLNSIMYLSVLPSFLITFIVLMSSISIIYALFKLVHA